jgi:hypothetical protein
MRPSALARASISDGENVVRFLAFTGGAETAPAIEKDRRTLIPGACTALLGGRASV